MQFTHLLLPHAMARDRNSVMVEATKKIDEYLKYRKSRLNELFEIFEKANGERLTRD